MIFAVCVRFDDRTTNNLAKYCPNAAVLCILISIRLQSRKPCRQMVPLVGDARLVLEQMLELLEQEEAQQPLWTTFATGGSRSSSGVPVIVCATTTRAIKSNRRR
ncbi:hypothetical protein MJK72_05130 [Klebsiella pneumoniae]|nr:hypothetical protein MJK72_05130 [Klebsiella pneumoniae]